MLPGRCSDRRPFIGACPLAELPRTEDGNPSLPLTQTRVHRERARQKRRSGRRGGKRDEIVRGQMELVSGLVGVEC
jgi:hypothetical protein